MPTITKSIGVSGRDYSTITAWEADLDNGAVYASGDTAVGECYNDAVFDESFNIDGGGTVGLAFIRLTVASGQRHTGIAGTGARIVRTGSVTGVIATLQGNIENEVSWLEIDTKACTGGNRQIFSMVSGAAITTTVKNCILHGFAGTNSTSRFFTTGGISGTVNNVMNNIMYDMVLLTRAGQNVMTAINTSSGSNRTHNIYNNTIYHIHGSHGTETGPGGIVFADTATTRIRNNVVCDVVNNGAGGGAECLALQSPSNATLSHNATSDNTSTGTGALNNIVTADQFVSIVGGSENLHLKAASSLLTAGTDLGNTPSGVEIDIDGYDRDTSGATWSIGADQWSTHSIAGTIAGAGSSSCSALAYRSIAGTVSGAGSLSSQGVAYRCVSGLLGASGGVSCDAVAIRTVIGSMLGVASLDADATVIVPVIRRWEIGEAVRSHMLQSENLLELLGETGTIQQSKIDQCAVAPYIFYERREIEEDLDLGGQGGIVKTTWNVECVGRDIDEVLDLASEVRSIFHGYRGYLDTVSCLMGEVEDQTDDYEPRAASDEGNHIGSLILTIYHHTDEVEIETTLQGSQPNIEIGADLCLHLASLAHTQQGKIDQENILPYIWLARTSGNSETDLAGNGGIARTTFAVECVAETLEEAIDLADDVREALHGYRGDLGNTSCLMAEVSNQDEKYFPANAGKFLAALSVEIISLEA